MDSSHRHARPGGTRPPAHQDGYQALAVAVIHQAFDDLTAGNARLGSDAARFFKRGSPDLRFWAAVAGIDPTLAAERAWLLCHSRAPARRCA